MRKAKKKEPNKLLRLFFIIFGLIFILIIALFVSYEISYKNKIYPHIKVARVEIGGNKISEASLILTQEISKPNQIVLSYQEQEFIIKADDINLAIDATKSAEAAYKIGRQDNFFNNLFKKTFLLVNPVNIDLVYSLDEEKFIKILSVISDQISIDAIEPSVSKSDKKIVVDKGRSGKEVNQEKLISLIEKAISQNKNDSIEIPVDIIDHTLNDNEAEAYQSRANEYLGKSITLKFEYSPITLQDSDILKMLSPHGGFNEKELTDLTAKISKAIERNPQEPKFVFDSGKVSEFKPALDGIKLDQKEFIRLIEEKLTELQNSETKNISFDIPVTKIAPEISTDEVNSFGIKELIGRGTSTYYHSIPGRVHNVYLAASKINGTLVKPGETFSFNQTLGDVSAFTGYQQAYIISEGKTILGDGGGVCQVSSTLFRAVLDAGLPILERQAHAYRVGYYEQNSPPGFDATVYSPSPDFKFTNDTGNYILIEAIADTKKYSLVFELYGTKDGRSVTISKPVVTNVSAPPPDVYQDDQSLPMGIVKQVDYKAWGAKVTFNYIVIKNDKEIINKTFVSNYKPWAAVYLRGTGPSN